MIARQHGGGDEVENLALACNHCNLHKGSNLTGIDPLTNLVVALFHPRRDRWADHFEVSGATIEGTTTVGRATLTLLQMNAPKRLRLRAASRF